MAKPFPDSPRSSPGVAVMASKPKPPGPPDSGDNMPDAEPDADDSKMSAERALVTHADENCGNCSHWDEATGECEKVEGVFKPDDRCFAAYWPKEAQADPAGAEPEGDGYAS